ncbi:hypothetical protein EB796_014863 [Bugula neritina]|uniref:LIM zinc-binding domain-containing protein n=1 Tax=Bugula neritina TaxID=10212 RepID=A0A7J7JLB8_BUGNE|nr:hypothetical protein EB796_014863 [Bugula neritina]
MEPETSATPTLGREGQTLLVASHQCLNSSLNALLNREPNPNEICYFCKKRIYLVERQSAEGKYFHRLCFRCYFCDIPLHIGSYTIHRTSLGHARFYCDQHVGRERSAALPNDLVTFLTADPRLV